MKALHFNGRELRLIEKPAPISVDEAVIRVRMAGICRTDLEILKGYMGFRGVLGHEFVGEVVEAPRGGWIGHRVVGSINCPCRQCSICRAGLLNHCPARTVLGIAGRDGAFAEFVLLPLENLFEVPESLPDEVAVFSEPLAAALRILEQVKIEEGMETGVVGDGKLGLLAAQVLKRAGAEVFLVGKHRRKMEILKREGFRVNHPGEAKENFADLIVECSGSHSGLIEGIRILKPGGTLVLKSTSEAAEPLNLSGVVVKEIKVVGSRCGPFSTALSALEGGRLKLEPLIDGIYSAENYRIAFERAREPESLKILLTF